LHEFFGISSLGHFNEICIITIVFCLDAHARKLHFIFIADYLRKKDRMKFIACKRPNGTQDKHNM